VNPKPFLLDLIDKPVVVKLKWGLEYKGMNMNPSARLFDKYLDSAGYELLVVCWNAPHRSKSTSWGAWTLGLLLSSTIASA